MLNRIMDREKILNRSALFCMALAGMLLAVAFFSAAHFSIAPFEFTVELLPLRGGDTVIFIPPVGELQAATHYPPFLLRITLLNVDLDYLRTGLEELAAAGDTAYLEARLRDIMSLFMLRTTLLAFIGGAGAAFLLSRRREIRRVALGGFLGAGLFLLVAGVTLLWPYDIDAFENPQYTGLMGAAPWVVNLTDQVMATVKALGDQLEVMTANLHDLSRQLEQVRPVSDDHGLRVLHVSDIHNNPAAIEFIEKVAACFAVDLIIDTGDLTDYGTELETELIGRVALLKVPYVFVPGNHDSPQVAETMRRQGAIVLEEGVVEVAGLRIAGFADPSAAGPMMAIAPDHVLRQAAGDAYRALAAEERRPDVLAVHHPLMGETFAGIIPVILSGHTHRARVDFSRGSVLINAGSTGAAGVRGLQSPRDNPYSAAVLYFSVDEEGRYFFTMVDLLSVQQYQDSLTLQRYYYR